MSLSPDLKLPTEQIEKAQSVVLTTHRQCDGDGLGAEIGLYHALKNLGKTVRILNVDATPKKYSFLDATHFIQHYDAQHTPLETTDLALILDTNDRRLVEPLYSELEKKCAQIIFIDHHPHLKTGPATTPNSFIDTTAASTGEIAFDLIKELGAPLTPEIARAIYTSIAFDTQLFRYVRNSPKSHLIAAELLEHETNPAEVHRYLFANHSVDKIRFLSKTLERIEYFENSKIAILKLNQTDLLQHNMDPDESRDLIDMLMNIDTLVAGAMLREEPNGDFKVSLRSKGQIEVRSIAEGFGGGGHLYAAGATTSLSYDELKSQVVSQLTELITTLDDDR